jgi:tRNA nucleotidyltransferase (CCA-adding enzyme)
MPETAIETLCERLRVPQECRELALLSSRYCPDIGNAAILVADALLSLLQATDAFRRPERFEQLLEVCVVAPQPASEAAMTRLRDALAAARAVDAGAVAQRASDPAQIKDDVARARVAAIRHTLETAESQGDGSRRKE